MGLERTQHFGGRKACWSSRMGLRRTHKQEFKTRSTCTTKKKGQLVQIKWKMCNGFNEDNFKHKLHMAHNLWEEAPFPSLYYTLCLPWGLHPNVIFPQYSQVEVPKLGLLLSQNFECSYLFQIKFSLKIQGEYLTALENIFPKVYSMFQSDLI